MGFNLTIRGFSFFLLLFIFVEFEGYGQSQEKIKIEYISPLPGSKYVMPGNNIALRHGDPFSTDCTKNSLLKVRNLRGNLFSGELILSDDNRTLIFLPDKPFDLGDEIHVTLLDGLYTAKGVRIQPMEFNFFITDSIIPIDQKYVESVVLEKRLNLRKPSNKTVKSSIGKKDNNLPEGYAINEVLINNNPPEGYYFFAPYDEWNWYPETLPFITITDVYGTPVFYRKLENYGFDLKVQPNGALSFYSFHPFWKHQVMDSSYLTIATYQMGNGYTYTDFHDFQLFENGHAFVMTFDPQLVDMSQIVPGGNPEAIVSGFVMQELDSIGNVIFQWRSWDHFEITETDPEIDLTAESIDPVHGNTIEVESDTSILISSRNMNEITKINRNTGDIIWRLGGSQNEFELIGDTMWFNRQHDSRRIYNGNVTAYDNGSLRPEPRFSSAVEYTIDTLNKTATLINRYRHNPDYLGLVMGNSYWTPDSTVIIGWGSEVPGITEIDLEGNILYELLFEGVSYRAFRFPWETNYFHLDFDTINFNSIVNGDSATVEVNVYNPQDEPIEITSFYNMSDNFMVTDTFPILVPAGDSAEIHVQFLPDSVGLFEDVLTINSDINTEDLVQRIAKQMVLTGKSNAGQGTSDFLLSDITVYPNPVRKELIIENQDPGKHYELSVFNQLGEKLLMLDLKRRKNQINMSDFLPGIYFLRLESQSGETHTSKIIKQ